MKETSNDIEQRLRSDYLFMFDQSRNHFRHLENLRTQYLGFLFTVLIASVTVGTSLLKDAKQDHLSTVIFGLIILIFINFVISLNILVAIIKFGFARKHHQDMINRAALGFGFDRNSPDFPHSGNDPDTYRPNIYSTDVFSVQKSAEFVVLSISFVLAICLVGVGLFVANSSSIDFHWWQSGAGILAAIGAAIYSYRIIYPVFLHQVLRPMK